MSFDQPPLIVITGASSGIGAAIAEKFGKGNFKIVLIARRKDRLEQIQKQIQAPVSIYELDVTNKQAVSETFQQILHTHGPIDLLVNNAGLALGLEPAHKTNLGEWDQCVDVNIKGLLYCTHAALPEMVKNNKGHIINMGSISASYPYPGAHVYGATKAFVRQFSLNLRADLLGTGVRVSCIEPGMVGGTEFSAVRLRGNLEGVKKIYEGIQYLTADDIAETVHFCFQAPPHVNINLIELMPVGQASGPLAVHREV